MNDFNNIPTRIDIDAPDRREWKRLVIHHVGAWATWEDKTPAPVFLDDFSEAPTKEIILPDESSWLRKVWQKVWRQS